mmetsp:Transcript_36993/g.41654  ORF Transcript_36993/g.41654 Transcript_36993/m.41654 type:complete len:840 (-) Transcript_36993:136-2655(-)
MTVAKESSPLLTGDSNGPTMSLKGNPTEHRTSSIRNFSKQMMKSLSSEDRRHALKELGVGPAAFLIRDAVLGFQDAPYEGFYDPYMIADRLDDPEKIVKNAISFVCGRLIAYNWVSIVLYGTNWILFILSFVEPPQWCRNSNLHIVQNNLNDDLNHYGDCQVILWAKGTAADGEENQDYYPNFNMMLLTISQSKNIELICIFTIFSYLVLKLGDDGMDFSLFFYPGTKKRLHSLRLITLACLLIGVLVDNTVLNPFFRMLILGSHLRNFQKELWTLLKMIPEMVYILAMLAIIIIFYAWFGVIIFYDTPQGTNGFSNLCEAVWTLWICVTTANYPDVMMPSYNENRFVSSIYFISFMTISFFYLMNLILAVTVNSYDESIAERKISRQELSKDLLTKAFKSLDHDNDGSISRESVMAVMLILNQDVPEIRKLSENERSIIFAFLDRDGSSDISLDEFMDFGNVLLLDFEKESDYATFVEIHFPRVNQSNWYQGLCKVVKSTGFEYAVDVILVLNAVIIAFQDYPMLSGQDDATKDTHYNDGNIDTVWELMEAVFTMVYVLEAILKIIVLGWKRYSQSGRNIFDFSITLMAVLASAYVYYPNAYSNSQLIRLVIMARVIRLGRLLFAMKVFRTFGTITFDILPAASNVFMILLFIVYFFASIGVFLYGGLITRDPANPLSFILLEADDFVGNNYWANNFNDMMSGMNVLFNLLVVNNWTECEVGFEYVTGTKWVRYYFFCFHLGGVIVISNVVTSFIINAYFQQLETIVQRLGREEDIGEARLTGNRGVFDASTVTGTRTGINSSIYIARINPRHNDIEVDERAALRHLFTRNKMTKPAM